MFFASAYLDKPSKSPIIWFVIGLMMILAHSFDAWNWYHSPLLEKSNSLEPDIHELVKQSVMKKYKDSLFYVILGIIISIISATKLAKRNSKSVYPIAGSARSE
jgi:hypothetical protein